MSSITSKKGAKKHTKTVNELSLENTEKLTLEIRESWLSSTEIVLQLGVKSDTARRVLRGLHHAGKINRPIDLRKAPIKTAFLQTPMLQLLGKNWTVKLDEINVILTPELKQKLSSQDESTLVIPKDFERKVAVNEISSAICYHPIVQNALRAYLLKNLVASQPIQTHEQHWISCNELSKRLRNQSPPISIGGSKLTAQLADIYQEKEHLVIHLKSGENSKKPIHEVMGFRQKPSGGIAGWWVDPRTFGHLKELVNPSGKAIALSKEDRDKYRSVRQLSNDHSKLPKHDRYIRGREIITYLYEILQEHPLGYTLRIRLHMPSRVRARLRTFEFSSDSLVLAKTKGVAAIQMNESAAHHLTTILKAQDGRKRVSIEYVKREAVITPK